MVSLILVMVFDFDFACSDLEFANFVVFGFVVLMILVFWVK